MRLMFVYFLYEYAGSARAIRNYAEAATAVGHEVVVYGPAGALPPFGFSMDVGSADAVIFVFEWTTDLRFGDRLDLSRLMIEVPRERRVVIDCDGNYNDPIAIGGDYNHPDAAASRRWTEICDSLSDKICQPTLHPLRANVRPFLFYAYDPAAEIPLDFTTKEYGMLYVGHSKFRWQAMHRVLQALEPIRDQLGRVCLIGDGWDALPPWAGPMRMEDAFYTDPAYMQKLDIEVALPIPFEQVPGWMSKANVNPVLNRPLFEYLGFVTPRMFETPAASTIPLLGLKSECVREIYGDCATGLVLPDDHPEEKILDMVRQPDRYCDVLMDVRAHLADKHAHAARLQELIEIVES